MSFFTGLKRKHQEAPTVSTRKIDAGVYENIGGITFLWNDCGDSKGCFRSPAGCEPQRCDVIFSWKDMEDEVHFELSTLLSNTMDQGFWTALGISETPGMVNYH